jgi:hypothetical protein
MTERNAQHFRAMFTAHPTARIGFVMAASAIYAQRHGICEAEHHEDREWWEIARALKSRYGDTLTVNEVLLEMDSGGSPASLFA